MKVLSLFDGISCGQIALARAGIHVDEYFASEIDSNSIKVTMSNFPKTKHLGDVTKLYDLPIGIDLLLGGSPCQGFSFAGKVLNFEDPRSLLFFEYVRILNTLPSTAYFLFENVKMSKGSRDIITSYLKVEPICINSRLVSGQNRIRYYWTNVPNIQSIRDRGITLSNVIGEKVIGSARRGRYINGSYGATHQVEEFRVDDKSNTITTVQKNCRVYILSTKQCRSITVREAERLQTLPEGYTKDVSASVAHKLIGNCWTVDIITELLSNLPKEIEQMALAGALL